MGEDNKIVNITLGDDIKNNGIVNGSHTEAIMNKVKEAKKSSNEKLDKSPVAVRVMHLKKGSECTQDQFDRKIINSAVGLNSSYNVNKTTSPNKNWRSR